MFIVQYDVRERSHCILGCGGSTATLIRIFRHSNRSNFPEPKAGRAKTRASTNNLG